MKKFLRIAIYFFIFFGVWIPLAWGMANFLIVSRPREKADAIVVLSGSAAYKERVREAASIFKKGVTGKIFLTNDGLQGGWDQNERRNPYFVERAHSELIQLGVPNEAIEVLPAILDGTDEEANLLVHISAERKIKALLIVTSDYHSHRALWTFEKAVSRNEGSLNLGIVSPKSGQQSASPYSWWISYQGWKIVTGEYLKFAYYWMYY